MRGNHEKAKLNLEWMIVPCLSALIQLAEIGAYRAISWNSATVLMSEGGGKKHATSLSSISPHDHFLHGNRCVSQPAKLWTRKMVAEAGRGRTWSNEGRLRAGLDIYVSQSLRSRFHGRRAQCLVLHFA